MTPSDDIVATKRADADAGKIIWLQPGPPQSLNVLPILLVPPGAMFSPPSDASPFVAMQLADGSLLLVLQALGQMTAVEEDVFHRLRLGAVDNPHPGAAEPYIPRSDPEYRCEAFMRAVDGSDLAIADLLM